MDTYHIRNASPCPSIKSILVNGSNCEGDVPHKNHSVIMTVDGQYEPNLRQVMPRLVWGIVNRVKACQSYMNTHHRTMRSISAQIGPRS